MTAPHASSIAPSENTVRPMLLSLLLLTTVGCAQGAPYRIEPAPALLPSPTPAVAPTPAAEAAPNAVVSPEAAKAPRKRRHATESATPTPTDSPTATLTPTVVLGFYLQPFSDKRPGYQIFKGKSNYDSIYIEAAGLTLQAQSWQEHPYGAVALLWHRKLGQALAKSGLGVQAAADPLPSESMAVDVANGAGARYLVTGVLKRFAFEKRGADPLFGTAFSGTNYNLEVQVQLKVIDVTSQQAVIQRKWEFKRTFYDPTRMGSDDSKRYPGYFVEGMDEATASLAGDPQLRALVGLAPYTATPTPTRTSEVKAPPAGQMPEATATPEPTADTGPYWVNPKTGNRVDPEWNFDPADGTPRKDFVLREHEAKKAPLHPTDSK